MVTKHNSTLDILAHYLNQNGMHTVQGDHYLKVHNKDRTLYSHWLETDNDHIIVGICGPTPYNAARHFQIHLANPTALEQVLRWIKSHPPYANSSPTTYGTTTTCQQTL